MIVRCGSCRTELDVAGTGEFMCPACGTRNVVRGDASAASGIPDLGALSITGAPPTQSEAPPRDVRWVTCPSCSFRFACVLDEVSCPTCSAHLTIDDAGAHVAIE